MATTFRTEDEAVVAEHAVWSFSGPHSHAEFTGRFVEIFDTVAGCMTPVAETVDVPCDGCWY